MRLEELPAGPTLHRHLRMHLLSFVRSGTRVQDTLLLLLLITAMPYMCRLFTEAALGCHMFQCCLVRDITLLSLQESVQQSRHQ